MSAGTVYKAAIASLPLLSELGPTTEGESFQLQDLSQLRESREQARKRLEEQLCKQRRDDEKFFSRLDQAESGMKFSHSIQFNAVPDWSSHYIAYSNLKKMLVLFSCFPCFPFLISKDLRDLRTDPLNSIYQLEKNVVRASSRDDTEESALIANAREPAVDTDLVYRRTLDHELEKISSFYNLKEEELLREVYELSTDTKSFEEGRDAESVTDSPLIGESSRRRHSLGGLSGILRTRSSLDTDREDDTDDDEEEEEHQSGAGAGLLSKLKRGKGWSSNMEGSHTSHVSDSGLFQRRTSQTFDEYQGYAIGALYDKRVMLKKRAISLFVALRELKSFVQLNRTGFVKALKKYDKILNRSLKSQYIQSVVEPCYCFRPETTAELDKAIGKVEEMYASLVTGGDLDAAKRELRLHLREHVVWERNTVWREMIGIERKAQAANMGIRRTLLGDTTDPTKSRLTGDEPEISTTKELETPVGKIKYSTWIFSGGFFVLMAVLLIFTVLLFVPIFPSPEQQNCLAMLVLVSLLWATEVFYPLNRRTVMKLGVNLFLLGYPALCDISSCSVLGGSSSSCTLGREAAFSTGDKGCY